jgi:uncharacterized membrane protein
MALYLVAYVLPGLLAIVAAPLALGKIPPNQIYGFRTLKTLSSPDIWYPANRMAGWWMIAAGALPICLNLVVWETHPEWPSGTLASVMGALTLAAILIGAALSFAYLRKLPNRNQ